jgi:hypothetical protein
MAFIANPPRNHWRSENRLAVAHEQVRHEMTRSCFQPKPDSEKATLQNAVTATDHQIDQLVYELYGLTPEEIRLVEGNGWGSPLQNPKGIPAFSPGLARPRAYPGTRVLFSHNPNGVAAPSRRNDATPMGLMIVFIVYPG